MFATELPLIVQAASGLAAGHVAAGLTRGGGGLLTRSAIGVLGGVALAQALPRIAAAAPVQAALYSLSADRFGALLGDIAAGALGGALAGLIAGAVLRPRR